MEKHTHTTPGKTTATCINCGCKFAMSREEEILIEEGIIRPLDVNLCPECAEEANDQAIFEAELDCIINNL
jgi:hypothetical protein